MSEDSLRLGESLKCSCGFYTTLSRYLLLHLSEGRCAPTDQHCYIIRGRLSELHVKRMALTDSLTKIDEEEHSLGGILALAERPIVKARAKRPCCICKQLTNDMFGDVPQCVRHTAGSKKNVLAAHGKEVAITDEQKKAVSDILEDLFHGN